jgi:tetratricopeptide (TPR) repeat protein
LADDDSARSCAAGPIVAKFRAVKSSFFARRALALLSVGVGLYALGATPSTAVAQTRSASQKLEAIRQLMEKGQGLYIAGNYQGAAELFEGGFQQYPYSAFLFNAGICYQKLNEADRALGKFRDYLKIDPGAPDAEKVRQRIALLEVAKGAPAMPEIAGSGGSGGSDASAGGLANAGSGGGGAAPTSIASPSLGDHRAQRSRVVGETRPADPPQRF